MQLAYSIVAHLYLFPDTAATELSLHAITTAFRIPTTPLTVQDMTVSLRPRLRLFVMAVVITSLPICMATVGICAAGMGVCIGRHYAD